MTEYKEELKEGIYSKYDSRVSKINRSAFAGMVLGATISFGGMLYGCSKMENPYRNTREVIEFQNFKFKSLDKGLKEIVDKSQEKYISVQDIQSILNEQELVSKRFTELNNSSAVKNYYKWQQDYLSGNVPIQSMVPLYGLMIMALSGAVGSFSYGRNMNNKYKKLKKT